MFPSLHLANQLVPLKMKQAVVLPAVPIEASNAYCVAVYVLSTNNEMKATNATVAKAAVISSAITAIANNNSDLPVQATKQQKEGLLEPLILQQQNIVLMVPALIAITPPNNVKTTVVIQPKPFE